MRPQSSFGGTGKFSELDEGETIGYWQSLSLERDSRSSSTFASSPTEVIRPGTGGSKTGSIYWRNSITTRLSASSSSVRRIGKGVQFFDKTRTKRATNSGQKFLALHAGHLVLLRPACALEDRFECRIVAFREIKGAVQNAPLPVARRGVDLFQVGRLGADPEAIPGEFG